MIPKILLKTNLHDNSVPITPVSYVRGQRGYVQLGPVAIGAQAAVLAALLRTLAAELEKPHKPTSGTLNGFNRVLTISPLEVIQYFEQSSTLREIAPDVRAVLMPHNLTQVSQLEQDLQAVNHLDSPSLADISEVLTGSRQYGGATYKRVKHVAQALNNTTTTPIHGSTGVEIREQAA